jgi:hypothetical protein
MMILGKAGKFSTIVIVEVVKGTENITISTI